MRVAAAALISGLFAHPKLLLHRCLPHDAMGITGFARNWARIRWKNAVRGCDAGIVLLKGRK